MRLHFIKNNDDVKFLVVYWNTYDCANLTNDDIEKELKQHHIYYVCGSPYALYHKDHFWYIGSEDDGCIVFTKDRRYHEDWHKYFVKTVKESKHDY